MVVSVGIDIKRVKIGRLVENEFFLFFFYFLDDQLL